MGWRGIAVVCVAVFLFQTVWWLAQGPPASAWAQEAVPEVAQVVAVKCKVFAIELNQADVLDTEDRTSVVGQWVGKQADASLKLHSMDFEVGQKLTGYQQGWVQVCMSP